MTTMQRRHYELIAEGLRCGRPPKVAHLSPPLDVVADKTWRGVCRQMAGTLARDNANFDRSRFLRACGVED